MLIKIYLLQDEVMINESFFVEWNKQQEHDVG